MSINDTIWLGFTLPNGNTTADALNGTGGALIRKCKKKSVGENPTLL